MQVKSTTHHDKEEQIKDLLKEIIRQAGGESGRTVAMSIKIDAHREPKVRMMITIENRFTLNRL